MQEVNLEEGGTRNVGDYFFLAEQDMKFTSWECVYFTHHRIESENKRGNFLAIVIHIYF
jgi:hypothetical protein